MNKFVVGDRVISKDSGNKGEVTNGFYYRDPATGLPPHREMIPIQWDNGTESYIHPDVLSYEEV